MTERESSPEPSKREDFDEPSASPKPSPQEPADPWSEVPAYVKKLVECLAVEGDRDLWSEYGEATQYVTQLAHVVWRLTVQCNTGANPLEFRHKRDELFQIMWREYPAAAEKLQLPTPEAITKPGTLAESTKREVQTAIGFCGLGSKKSVLSQYFDNLTDRQRECASLHWEYGLRVAEIARRLGVHRSTVEESLNAAKKRLERDGKFRQALKKRAAHRSSHDE